MDAVPNGVIPELLLRVAYVASFMVALVGAASGDKLSRQLGLVCGPAVLGIWLLPGRLGRTWASAQYGYSVLVGLALLLLGELVLSEPLGQSSTYPAFLFLCAATAAFACAVSSPTPWQSVHGKDVGRRMQPLSPSGARGEHALRARASYGMADPHHLVQLGATVREVARIPRMAWEALRIPLRMRLAIVPFIIAALPLILWALVWTHRTAATDSRFLPSSTFLFLHALLLWRALARVGYRAPLLTALRLLHARAARTAFLLDRLQLFPSSPSQASSFGSDYTRLTSLRGESDTKQGFSAPLQDAGRSLHTASGVGGVEYSIDTVLDEAMDEEDGDAGVYQGAAGGTGLSGSPAGLRSPKRASTAPLAARAAGAERVAQLRGMALSVGTACEERSVQWRAVAGAVCLALGQAAVALDRLWLSDVADSEFPTGAGPGATVTDIVAAPPNETLSALYVHIVATALGAGLLASSVPLLPADALDSAKYAGRARLNPLAALLAPPLPPVRALDDPTVFPQPTGGLPLRVLIVLPGNSGEGADAAELAAYWTMLTRRGHSVSFSTRCGWRGGGGRTLTPPAVSKTSLSGLGCLARGHVSNAGMEEGEASGAGTTASLHSLTPAGAAYGLGTGQRPAAGRRRALPVGGGGGRARGREDSPYPPTSDPGLLCSDTCGALACSSSSLAVELGPVVSAWSIASPGPLLSALFAEMRGSQAYRRPLAWALASSRPGAQEEAHVQSDGIESTVDPETFDGIVIVGRHLDWHGQDELGWSREGEGEGEAAWTAAEGKRGQRHIAGQGREENNRPVEESLDNVRLLSATEHRLPLVHADLQAMIRVFWSNRKPVATLGTGLAVLAGCRGNDGRALLAGADGRPPVPVACTPRSAEVSLAVLLGLCSCRWRAARGLLFPWCERMAAWGYRRAAGGGVGRSGGGAVTLYDMAVEATGDASRVLTGPGSSWWDLPAWCVWMATGVCPSGLLRQPQPRPGPLADASSFVVTAPLQCLVSGRCTGDVFAVARAFTAELEGAARVY